MPDNDDNLTDIYKILCSSEEDIKAKAVIKIFKDGIEQITKSFEKTYQEKLEEKTKEIKKDLTEKFDEKLQNIEDKHNETHTKSWIIITGLVILCVNIIGWSIKYYINFIDEKINNNKYFCEKIVDEKIKNITLKK